MTQFQIRQCTEPTCRLRFPVTPEDRIGKHCPRCGSPIQIVIEQPDTAPISLIDPAAQPLALHVLLDNVRSTFNVGSIFRTADGAGVQQLYLCGITPTPEHPKVGKTALGAEQAIAWSQHHNAVDLACSLQARGATLWALEDGPTAASLFKPTSLAMSEPVVLIMGNEVTGVDPGLLAICDRILAIPMSGVKRSLNVATAFGIAIYEIRRQLEERNKHL
ncbi:MAG: RNA methyltransferase [Chloroflexi bacterium]|nr:RNA methyltransferase [Chloroflexota bacterium]